MKIRPFAAALLVSLSMPAVAEVHQFSTCHLNEGKTAADAYTLLEQRQAWAEAQEGLPQESTVEIMWPFFGGERQPGTFVLHFVTEDFGEFGQIGKMIWDDGLWQQEPWYVDDTVWYCTQTQILWVPGGPPPAS